MWALGLLGFMAGWWPGPAAADGGPTVAVRFEDRTTDFGRLHVNLALLGYQFSKPTGGLTSSASVVYDLHRRVAWRVHATTPLLLVAGGEHAPWRGEAMMQFWAKDTHDKEQEYLHLSSQRRGDMIETESVNVPIVTRNKQGLGLGLIYNMGDAQVDIGGTSTIVTEHNLIAVAGMHTTSATGYRAAVQGYGKRSAYRWMSVGLDAMARALQTTDAPEPGARWGGRLWAEGIFFKPAGISTRLEVGKYPGHIGWVFGISVGGGFHM